MGQDEARQYVKPDLDSNSKQKSLRHLLPANAGD